MKDNETLKEKIYNLPLVYSSYGLDPGNSTLETSFRLASQILVVTGREPELFMKPVRGTIYLTVCQAEQTVKFSIIRCEIVVQIDGQADLQFDNEISEQELKNILKVN